MKLVWKKINWSQTKICYNFFLQRINRRRPKPKFFKSTSGSSSVEYSADVEDTGVGLTKKLQIDIISSLVLGVNLQ